MPTKISSMTWLLVAAMAGLLLASSFGVFTGTAADILRIVVGIAILISLVADIRRSRDEGE